jgi:hypothetical protein
VPRCTSSSNTHSPAGPPTPSARAHLPALHAHNHGARAALLRWVFAARDAVVFSARFPANVSAAYRLGAAAVTPQYIRLGFRRAAEFCRAVDESSTLRDATRAA